MGLDEITFPEVPLPEGYSGEIFSPADMVGMGITVNKVDNTVSVTLLVQRTAAIDASNAAVAELLAEANRIITGDK